MSRYVMSRWDGSIDATFSPSTDQIEVKFGEVSIDITPAEAAALRSSLEQALLVSTMPKCPECNGRKVIRRDGKWTTCDTCDYTGMAPIAEDGAR